MEEPDPRTLIDDAEPTLLRHIDLGKASGSSGWMLDHTGRQIISVFNPDTDINSNSNFHSITDASWNARCG